MNRTVRLAVVPTLTTLVLGLSACGSDQTSTATPESETVTVTQSPADGSTRAGGSGRSENGNTGTDNAGNGAGNLAAAARTASGAVPGTVVSVDRQRDGWEVDVVPGDGSETRVAVSADGGRITGQRPDDQDADDRAENQRLLTSGVDWAAALRTARGELGDDVEEIDLGEDDGRITWEASLPGDGPGTTVVIDAGSGQVIGTGD